MNGKRTAGTVRLVLGAVVVLLGALFYHACNDFIPVDSYWPTSAGALADANFAESYYEARALFRKRARALNATLHAVPLNVSDLELTMDFAVLEGSKENVLVHISATHGNEGYAGSAIQCALLEQLKQQEQRPLEERPTVIFLHAMNPFGFANNRRTNVNNVDLNRNFLSPEEFHERVMADPNEFGYADATDVLHPRDPSHWRDSFWLKSSPWEFALGLPRIKRAGVCGNYHFPQGLFYGGTELQPELKHFRQFLLDHLDLERLQRFSLVDVHTGLGPTGYDTIIILHSKQDPKRVVALGSRRESAVIQGYDRVSGVVCQGIATLLPKHVKNICAAQEFGTVPFIFGIKILIEENAMYFHQPHMRLPYADKMRDTQYLHRSASWKKSVVTRGTAVFHQLYENLK
ncbi:TPA: hypothetical protein N0F65_003915 [Lagenidium giganteum]|uniref:DUF2817 domain-containing protein n=1 Tax=Lagenidium giganteum TaxID=4803 RepID=A0AAV2ZB96_9STRA|nr:TPA: hypothetical protein N0F65_003915 [Lagenidium giganteum]